MHYRTLYRQMVSLAIEAQADFSKFQKVSAWSQTIDQDELPFFAVATPRETKDRTTHSSSTRDTLLAVVFKIRGGDEIEDTLDDLSIIAESVVLQALSSSGRDCVLTETTVDLDGGAGNRVGTLAMQFTITIWPAEPIEQ